jgi:choice-of-anchor C domain-containing protein
MKRPAVVWLIGAAAMAAATMALGASPALAAPSFTNGTFESGNYTGTAAAGFETLYAGTPSATAMTGWTVTSGSVDWIQTYWQQPAGVTNWAGQPDGPTYSIDLNGTASAADPNPAGTISQNFWTIYNNVYWVQFYLAGNPACGPSTKRVTVTATGGTSQTYAVNTSGTSTSNMGWTPEVIRFTAISNGTSPVESNTTLTFTADPSNTSNCGVAIADVSIFNTGPNPVTTIAPNG